MKLFKLIPAAAIVLTTFTPFEGKAESHCIKNDGAYIVNRESNEMNTKSQVSPQHIPQSLLKQLPEDARSAFNGIGLIDTSGIPSWYSGVSFINCLYVAYKRIL